MKHALVACLAAACVASACAVGAGGPEASTGAGCPSRGTEMPLEALFGTWEARIDGQKGVALVKLSQHPDYAGVRGTIARGGDGAAATVAQVAGDIDDEGMLSLDESLDGRAISGVWLGELQASSCGKEWNGIWRDAASDSTHPFVLNKIGNSGTDR
ncbi:hypothetical protein QTI24_29130 [Variovorax sp. J22P240]|uniref:hypothetical protein n=1 Tax=Variovorax sp. J22P240 TaxID=3053514 RepID=UPI0025769B84|nr:hypothetical protein [Variovorax sp. J22P240]MDM0002696.1 hypothetical protein [Variovorax sp. J22P240]